MSFVSNVYRSVTTWRTRLVYFMRRYPYRVFFVALGILLVLIIAGNILSAFGTKPTLSPTASAQVQVYRIGTSPVVTLQAKIEKSGIVKVNAQTAGIVQIINVTEGEQVTTGTTLFNLSTNYQGGNASSLQEIIAQKQNEITQSTYQEQKNLIQTQRNLANNQQSNNDQLRNLTSQSATDSANLINENQTILNTITNQLTTLQNDQSQNVPLPTGSSSYDQLIFQTQQLQAQYQNTINQLNSQERQLAYQADASQPFTQIQLNQRDITLKQLDIQDKTLDINKEISSLQLQLAEVNASLMFPSSPCDGVIDRIYATFGMSVTPGTPLASISCDKQSSKAVVFVPQNLATSVSRVQPTVIHIGAQTIAMTPNYVSQDATDGTLYTIVYNLPSNNQYHYSDGDYLMADVPIGLPDTSAVAPYIPLDAIYQTETSSYIFKFVNGHAKSASIQLGDVYGRFVRVLSGVSTGDAIILNRNIVDGDKVVVSQ